MDNQDRFGEASDLRGNYTKLARWLQQVLETPATTQDQPPVERSNLLNIQENGTQLALVLTDDYHLRFYQQLPDFIMALLNNDAQATVHYAPLLYHLVGCHTCHAAYLDLYDSLRAAVQPLEPRTVLGQGTRTLSATPHRMLSHLCRSLISQAEAVLRYSRPDHIDNDEAARALLQLALHVSAHIVQSTIRRQALHDLVRVATLFAGPQAPEEHDPHVRSYTPVMAGAGGMRRGKVVRRSDVIARSHNQDQQFIEIHSDALEGRVVQNGQMLELHLRDLDVTLRGRFLTISVLLGSLLEPVRWLGGNPLAIRSTSRVDEAGTLVTPLGQTDWLMSNPEEHNLLEAMFMLLQVRPSDDAG